MSSGSPSRLPVFIGLAETLTWFSVAGPTCSLGSELSGEGGGGGDSLAAAAGSYQR